MGMPSCSRRLLPWQQIRWRFDSSNARELWNGYAATNLLQPWTTFQSCAV